MCKQKNTWCSWKLLSKLVSGPWLWNCCLVSGFVQWEFLCLKSNLIRTEKYFHGSPRSGDVHVHNRVCLFIATSQQPDKAVCYQVTLSRPVNNFESDSRFQTFVLILKVGFMFDYTLCFYVQGSCLYSEWLISRRSKGMQCEKHVEIVTTHIGLNNFSNTET